MSRKRDDDEPALPAEIPQQRTMYFLLRAPTPISTMWPNPFPIKEHCTMAETHRLQIGSLRSDVALTLHTYHAAREAAGAGLTVLIEPINNRDM
ncbi:hypothetical protein AAIH31_33065, partial [Pseudomonas aeruginosa]